jgi:hypothetical protein
MNMKRANKTNQSAEDAYTGAHIKATAQLERIRELLQELPAPDTDGEYIHWGHVGSLGHVNEQLSEIVAFLAGE